MLAVENLTKRFGKKTAIDGLSFTLEGGRVLGLLGPNGAGKTTTFLCLAGLLRPDAGTVSLDGVRLGNERGRAIALIPETPVVHAMLTVWEHLIFVAKSARLDAGWERRASDLLERFELARNRDTLGRELSKGMRQKTLLAATILAQLPVLLFDEPMIGLDPRGQRELRDLVRELRATGTTILVSTHMLASAREICDELLIVKNGRPVMHGPIEGFGLDYADGRSLEDIFLDATA